MKRSMGMGRVLAAVILAPALMAASCRSYLIDSTIENRTGAPVQLIEVDYPSASFGVDSLAAGADFHYRIQVRLQGPLTISYTAEGHQDKITGPTLAEGQQGRLQIILLPGGKAKFVPELTPPPA